MARKLSLEQVVENFKKVHGDKYDYSLITKDTYIDTNHEVDIVCNTCGNVFKQLPKVHLRGCGCRLCANKRISQSNKGVARNDLKHRKYGIGICDVEHSVYQENGVVMPLYNTWHEMIKRCYSERLQKKEPAYIGCSICEKWKYYSNFKQWAEDPQNGYQEGYCLDKDILVKGNKFYSPDTCCFVPRAINSLLTNRKNHRGKYPVGVAKSSKSKNYEAAYFKNGKRIYLGSFDTPEKAFQAYKVAKELHIQDVAIQYYNEGKITKRVYDALMNYKIEIND